MDGKIYNFYFGCVILIVCLLIKYEYIIFNNEKCILVLLVLICNFSYLYVCYVVFWV